MAVHIVDHPLVRHKLSLLREAATPCGTFRAIASEIGVLLAYEATRDLETEPYEGRGWAGPVQLERISGKKLTIVPILRAGVGLMNGVISLMPGAKVSVIGLARDEATLQPVEYCVKLAKDIEHRRAILLDPMLATGGSLAAAAAILKRAGCRDIKSLNLVCAPEGIARMEREHPDVDIYTAAVDERLNEQGYILPGLGDAGDRIFGTR